MQNFRLLCLLAPVAAALLTGCRGPEVDPNAQFLELWKNDTTLIGSFVRANGLNMRKTKSGISFRVTQLGSGRPPKSESLVEVSYTGKLLDGTVFDAGNIDGVVSSFVPGFSAALQLLPTGSSAIFIIPSVYCYGQNGANGIPPNAPLIFDLSLDKLTVTSEELSQLYSDTTKIHDFLDLNNITGTIKDPSGLRYKITSYGSGTNVNWYDPVKISYTGRLLSNGETVVIGSSEPTVNADSWVINFLPAFQIALRKINPGSKITIYAPSGLVYGPKLISNGQRPIPVNSNFIFELELLQKLN